MSANPRGPLGMLQALLDWLYNPLTTPLLMFVCAFILLLLVGEPMIEWLRRKRWRKDAESWTVREDTPDSHQAKQGTPSMGGIGIIGTACFTFIALFSTIWGLVQWLQPSALTISWPQATQLRLLTMGGILLAPVTVVAHALLGFADDWSKASGRGGLRARSKFLAQVVLAGAFLSALTLLAGNQYFNGIRFIFPELFAAYPIGFFLGMIVLAGVIVGTCNAVNLTDGIDGLASGLAVQSFLALSLCEFNAYEVTYFSNLLLAALAGSCLGFLKFNRYKARVFMGDTGSLALGAAVGVGAILCHAVFLLPFVAFIFFVEMFSVMLQVGYFKWTKRTEGEGRRIFRRAPLHHHFELGGWSEWRVVIVFWCVNLVTTCVGLLFWNTGILPRWP